jgi:hypothetical protein
MHKLHGFTLKRLRAAKLVTARRKKTRQGGFWAAGR